MRILIAEDERDLNDLLKKRLEKQQYSVDACYDGQEALDYLEVTEYAAVILDIMMPKADGLTVLKSIRRKKKNIPVLLLTAKDSIEDRVTGLDLGADDYLVKPFAFEELLARIRVMIRKSTSGGTQTNIVEIADLMLDLNTHKVSRAGNEIDLSSKEFSILRYLALNQGIVLSREKIEQNIWNYDYMGSSNVIDVYIRYLRRKIDAPFEKKLIHTVRGAGYVLREEKEND
ncbi:MAG: response regulator transcription factor [Eubacteriales bacterium]|nr:response regulator transcription factor [Eubacteriales bacterium]